jgi:hypothetical protein
LRDSLPPTIEEGETSSGWWRGEAAGRQGQFADKRGGGEVKAEGGGEAEVERWCEGGGEPKE